MTGPKVTNKFHFQLIESTRAKGQKFRWRVVSKNGKIVCSSELYSNREGPKKVIDNLIEAVRLRQIEVDHRYTKG